MEAVMKETKEVKKEFSDLKFVRLSISRPEDVGGAVMLFNSIPRELFEQVKDVDFDIEKVFQLSSKILANPTILFYILIDSEDKIKGIFWAEANILSGSIDVFILSIDKEYQFGDAIKETLKFIQDEIQENAKVRMITTRVAKYENTGFKEIGTLMEIQNKGT